jgi:two-component system cell cycle response regulator DivK
MARVLIVEDNALNRDMLGRRLARRGYNVLLAADGPTGVAMARREFPNIVLMDIGLGEMDGLEATRLILSDPLTASIPIIALTASAFESDRERALAAGCIEFETKPVDLPRLLAKMEAALPAAVLRRTLSA